MPPVIRIPDALYARLEKHAKGFDTPAAVIERLLNIAEHGTAATDLVIEDERPAYSSPQRDATKYQFRGSTYGKGRLVLAVVHAFVEDRNGSVTHKGLMEAFPKQLQGSIGVVMPLSEAQDIYDRTGHKRHFLRPNEIVRASPTDMAVCTEWGKGNINSFIERALALGFDIEAV
jgi:hypothetical protein